MNANSTPEIAVPRPVDIAIAADVELRPAPIPAHWIVEGTPQARSKRLATSVDGTTSVIAWSCTPGRFRWHYSVDEILHIISGEVFVTDEKGDSRRLGPGDVVFFHAGTSSHWHVTKEIRKLAICRHNMPWPFGFALRVWKKLGAILSGPTEQAAGLENSPAVGSDAEQVRAA